MASNFSNTTEIANDQSNAILRNTITNERESTDVTTTTSSTFFTTTSSSHPSSNKTQRQNVGHQGFSENTFGQAETKPFNASVSRGNTRPGRGCHQKILNDAHFIRNRRISFNQIDRKTLELMCEDKVSRHKLEQAHTSTFSSSKHTFIMTFSPDGQQVASTHGDHRIYICDLNTGKLIDTLEGHPKTPWCLAWHPSNKNILASGCLAGEVRVWDLKSRACESWTSESSSIITSLDFHPKERLLVIAASNDVYFWDWSESQPFAKATTTHDKEKVKFVGFDSSGTKLITGIANLPKFGGHYVSDSLQYRIIDNYLTHGGIEQFPNSAPSTTTPMTENMTQNSEITGSVTSGTNNATNINRPREGSFNSNCIRSSQADNQDDQIVLLPTGPSTSSSSNQDTSSGSTLMKRKLANQPPTQQTLATSSNSSTDVDPPSCSASKKRKTETESLQKGSIASDGPGRSETDMIEPKQEPLKSTPVNITNTNSALSTNESEFPAGQADLLGNTPMVSNLSRLGLDQAAQQPARSIFLWNNAGPDVVLDQTVHQILLTAASNTNSGHFFVRIAQRLNGPYTSMASATNSEQPSPPLESRRRALSHDRAEAAAATGPQAAQPELGGQQPARQVYRMVRGSSRGNIAAAAAAAAAARQSIEHHLQPQNILPSDASAPSQEASQRHPHLHVYQTRGLGQHLWFEQWTIPLPMNNANYRLQCWNFSLTEIPNIKDSQSNVITRKCRIHNDSSVDISSDGTLVACLVPRGDSTCVPNFDLKVLSLKSYDFGACYHQIAHGPNAMSVSFSPSANYAVVGLATNKFVSNDPNDDDLTIGRVFKFNQRNSSSHVRDIKIKRDDTDALSLNAIRWISRGIVYNLGPKHGSRYQATRVRNRVA